LRFFLELPFPFTSASCWETLSGLAFDDDYESSLGFVPETPQSESQSTRVHI